MWKRIQNLYLAISTAFIISMLFCKIGNIPAETGNDSIIRYHEINSFLIMIIMILVANIMAIICLKKPLLQGRVSLISALLMIGFQIWLGISYIKFKGWMVFSVSMLFPLLCAFLNFMAARSAMIDGLTIQTLNKKKKASPKRRR
ncbi:MAG: DUF4293 family protein [Bacteroidales bacterium]|nr:DUF4293 family protein [Bacteroidales bacterium]